MSSKVIYECPHCKTSVNLTYELRDQCEIETLTEIRTECPFCWKSVNVELFIECLSVSKDE